MATIYSDSFHGGAGHTDGDEVPLALAFQDVADDLEGLRDGFVALTAKLDLDAGVTDTDYNTLNPTDNKTVNGGER